MEEAASQGVQATLEAGRARKPNLQKGVVNTLIFFFFPESSETHSRLLNYGNCKIRNLFQAT